MEARHDGAARCQSAAAGCVGGSTRSLDSLPRSHRRPAPFASPLAGSTLIECQKLLATQGAAHVSAYVTHGVFPKESWRRFEGEGSNGAADGFK